MCILKQRENTHVLCRNIFCYSLQYQVKTIVITDSTCNTFALNNLPTTIILVHHDFYLKNVNLLAKNTRGKDDVKEGQKGLSHEKRWIVLTGARSTCLIIEQE
eukprot:sb/3478191/